MIQRSVVPTSSQGYDLGEPQKTSSAGIKERTLAACGDVLLAGWAVCIWLGLPLPCQV